MNWSVRETQFHPQFTLKKCTFKVTLSTLCIIIFLMYLMCFFCLFFFINQVCYICQSDRMPWAPAALSPLSFCHTHRVISSHSQNPVFSLSLSAGNAAVVKPSELSEYSSLLLRALLSRYLDKVWVMIIAAVNTVLGFRHMSAAGAGWSCCRTSVQCDL